MTKIYKRVDSEGTIRWYKEGRDILHREDGPAIECADGTKYWLKNGNLHREDGPAIEVFNGNKYWYKQNKLHREDGPAIEHYTGTKEHWYEGVFYKVSSLDEFYIKRILE